MAVPTRHDDNEPEEPPALLDADEAEEILPDDAEGDHPMDSDHDGDDDAMDEDDEQIELTNDSQAYFDAHTSSIFSIAAHPSDPTLYLTGGGDDSAYIWTPDAPPQNPDEAVTPRASKTIKKFTGHTDSVSACAFVGPHGEYAVTGGLDGKVQVFSQEKGWALTAEAQEVEEVVWILSRPSAMGFALGANDGSVWIYDLSNPVGELTIAHAFYSHTASCTAGAWARSGDYLATVSEDGSFYYWELSTDRSVVALTAADSRFEVEGGLYSIAVSPAGAVAAVGGASGAIKIVGLPLSPAAAAARRTGARPQPGGGGSTGGGQAGNILHSLQQHTESVESLSFHPSLPLLASAGVDGVIVLYDAAHGYSVRRTLTNHSEAVVKVEWVDAPAVEGWVLTSCGSDGTVRRWDARAGAEIGVWKGHLGGNAAEGEGGVLGFVQTRNRVVTAGDDGVALVFEMGGAQAVGGVAAPTIGAPAAPR